MRSFLIQEGNRIDGVEAELSRLENAAKLALGEDEAAYADIERSSLLRRQIARRCIYGLDINPLAVELSRLAIWIHTFVPGLPMSSLEHGLVCANSLTGIGSVEEGLNALIPEREKVGTSLFDGVVEESLTKARDLLVDLANADEANKSQAKEAAQMARDARQAASDVKLIFDLAVANRNGIVSTGAASNTQELVEVAENPSFNDFVNSINAAHMPYLFPEVFLRDFPGFNAIVGNPPWEELVVDSSRFWASKTPGLLSVAIQERRVKIKELVVSRPDLAAELREKIVESEMARSILRSRFNLGVGDTDLYKAFGWVALELLSSDGARLGFVMPKTAFSAAGMEAWRRELQAQGSILELTYLVNTGQWVFDIDPRYSIALCVFGKGVQGDLSIAGPVHSLEEFRNLESGKPVFLDRVLALSFTESASIPAVSDQKTADVLSKMRLLPSLKFFENGIVRPVSEFHATNDRQYFDHGVSDNRMPVLSGKSFNIWTPETKDFFAWADPEIASRELKARMHRQTRLRRSAFFGLDFEGDLNGEMPYRRPRIAFRNITNATNTRTFVTALVPPDQILTNIAPYLFLPAGHEKSEAYLLGVMSSIIFDWYARRFIELAVNFHLLNAFPVPQQKSRHLTERITEIAGRLSAVDERFGDWASAVGVEIGSVLESAKLALVAELDALVAISYGLDVSDVTHIFTTFHRGWDPESRLRLVIKYHQEWGGRP
jgi:hypothetical protein